MSQIPGCASWGEVRPDGVEDVYVFSLPHQEVMNDWKACYKKSTTTNHEKSTLGHGVILDAKTEVKTART